MKVLRYIALLLLALISTSVAWAQYADYNPDSPDEPGDNLLKHKLVLLVESGEGGTVSGSGDYTAGTIIRVGASAKTDFKFMKWTDTRGVELSTQNQFLFTKTESKDTLVAHFDYSPGAPAEPVDPNTLLYYPLNVVADEGCSVSGNGKYKAGTKASLSVWTDSDYDFEGWYDAEGNEVSTATSLKYTMQQKGVTLYARTSYNPNGPDEPDGKPFHKIKVRCEEGGTVSAEKNKVKEGETAYLSANSNELYEFVGWYLNGEYYTSLYFFYYTMGDEDADFEARYNFNPDSPSEPSMPDLDSYSFYLMTVNGKPGDVVQYPIMLVNTKVIKDMLIRLTFPAGMTPDLSNFTLGNNAADYDVTLTPAVDTISILEEGAQLWDFTLIGGTTQSGTDALFTFDVSIPQDLATGEKHQVKINQISLTQEDGQTITARTRNGRIGVYRRGDVNGDNRLSVSDIVSAISLMNGATNNRFVPEVANDDGDGVVTEDDIDALLDMVTNEE